ncbi:hypothetical protein TNCV_3024561 [Trichonephila clavipes]|nr:hypothetical protein TNCV_3024561 [Trichonephila clavipes]
MEKIESRGGRGSSSSVGSEEVELLRVGPWKNAEFSYGHGEENFGIEESTHVSSSSLDHGSKLRGHHQKSACYLRV